MTGWRGFFAGVLGLSALYAVISTPQAAGRVGGLPGIAAAGLRRLLNPGIAGVANRHDQPSRPPVIAGSPGSGTVEPPGPNTPRDPNTGATTGGGGPVPGSRFPT